MRIQFLETKKKLLKELEVAKKAAEQVPVMQEIPVIDHELVDKLTTVNEKLKFFTSGNHPYHNSCYKELHHPKCDVCKNFIPTNAAGLIEYRAHPFWPQKYCPSHEHDGTPRCCSCERMEISRRPRIGGYRIIDMFMEPYRLVRKCELK